MTQSILIDIEELRVGMFVQLSVNWIRHPFVSNSFRITSPEQIRLLRDLGMKSVRYVPSKSVLADPHDPSHKIEAEGPGPVGAEGPVPVNQASSTGTTAAPAAHASPSTLSRAAQLRLCYERYHHAADTYGALATQIPQNPMQAREAAEQLVHACVQDLLEKEPCAIRLLSHTGQANTAAHAVNVMILALLLGRALGLAAAALEGLGLAALLHDIGKTALPAHIAEPGAPLVAPELQRYRAHVGESVAMGQRMDLPSDVLIAIAQHHERADGSGYPLRLMGEDLSREGQILALVNSYDRLCNPLQGDPVLTPHEAVSQLYTQQRSSFDGAILGAFIRLMGVYPPGSLVQLVDGRYALVIRVDALYPLRPWVLVHEDQGQALELDLSQHPELGIRRSLKPLQVPRPVLDALVPQQRTGYYFEHATRVRTHEEQA